MSAGTLRFPIAHRERFDGVVLLYRWFDSSLLIRRHDFRTSSASDIGELLHVFVFDILIQV
jgi:hypothetical protein